MIYVSGETLQKPPSNVSCQSHNPNRSIPLSHCEYCSNTLKHTWAPSCIVRRMRGQRYSTRQISLDFVFLAVGLAFEGTIPCPNRWIWMGDSEARCVFSYLSAFVVFPQLVPFGQVCCIDLNEDFSNSGEKQWFMQLIVVMVSINARTGFPILVPLNLHYNPEKLLHHLDAVCTPASALGNRQEHQSVSVTVPSPLTHVDSDTILPECDSYIQDLSAWRTWA